MAGPNLMGVLPTTWPKIQTNALNFANIADKTSPLSGGVNLILSGIGESFLTTLLLTAVMCVSHVGYNKHLHGAYIKVKDPKSGKMVDSISPTGTHTYNLLGGLINGSALFVTAFLAATFYNLSVKWVNGCVSCGHMNPLITIFSYLLSPNNVFALDSGQHAIVLLLGQLTGVALTYMIVKNFYTGSLKKYQDKFYATLAPRTCNPIDECGTKLPQQPTDYVKSLLAELFLTFMLLFLVFLIGSLYFRFTLLPKLKITNPHAIAGICSLLVGIVLWLLIMIASKFYSSSKRKINAGHMSPLLTILGNMVGSSGFNFFQTDNYEHTMSILTGQFMGLKLLYSAFGIMLKSTEKENVQNYKARLENSGVFEGNKLDSRRSNSGSRSSLFGTQGSINGARFSTRTNPLAE